MPTIVRDPLDPSLSMWHWLAFQLRYLRELNGLSLAQVGQLIGCARSTVSNQEADRRHIDMDQAAILDRRYGTGRLLQLLLHYAQISHDPEWFKQYSKHESQATILRVYSQMIIPAPLQVGGYIRALLTKNRPDLAEEVALRMGRQDSILAREDPPEVWLLLEEVALDNSYGGAEVMREQLRHLLDLDDSGRASVRVLPKDAEQHPGMGGPFRVITTDGEQVAYAGAYRGGRLIQTPSEVREAVLDFERIGRQALPAPQSRRLIERKMEAYA